MPQGSLTQEQVDFVETWENVSPITNYIIKLSPRGDEEHNAIEGKRQFTLTTHERIITQSKVLEASNDPFKNGCFRPVITPDDINIETSPNAISDEDILKIFRASQVAFNEWLGTVDSPATLRRMIDLADEDEGIPHKRYNQLKDRLTEVSGGPKHATQKDEDTYASLGGSGGGGGSSKDRKSAGKRAMSSGTTSTSN